MSDLHREQAEWARDREDWMGREAFEAQRQRSEPGKKLRRCDYCGGTMHAAFCPHAGEPI